MGRFRQFHSEAFEGSVTKEMQEYLLQSKKNVLHLGSPLTKENILPGRCFWVLNARYFLLGNAAHSQGQIDAYCNLSEELCPCGSGPSETKA